MNSFLGDIKNSFNKKDNALIQLIIINVAVFIGVNLLYTITFLANTGPELYDSILKWLAVPSSLSKLITRPWTVITYMFLHEGFFHILFNMLWLFWLGKILVEYLGNKKLISTYVLGGISGGLVYIIAFNVFPAFQGMTEYSYALGASAGVLAVVIATATLIPDYSIHLLFLGPVKLKYIAMFSIVIDVISIGKGNSGGHIAHLGGAIFGFIYIKQLQKGNDLASRFNKIMDSMSSMFSSKSNLKVSHKSASKTASTMASSSSTPDQEVIDTILDKIAKSGYDSLSKEEKDILFRASNRD
ncbi:MAG: rhomboid family intramembrane serine protease [Bacteroidia bacterium]|nr:rhomboid family intramembrane serine protease [Bacteroidia bacterium]